MTSKANTNASTKLYDVVFVLGGPGAGKGTQCARIVQHFGYVHLSAGELLRAEQARPESKVGQLIDHHIRNGTIVPVEVTCGLLEQEMKRNRETNGMSRAKYPSDSIVCGGNYSLIKQKMTSFKIHFVSPMI